MKRTIILKTLIIFSLILLSLLGFSKTRADIVIPYDVEDTVPENCDENGLITGTYCPCPPRPGLASVCGLVNHAEITTGTVGAEGETAHFARTPVPGVTVTIYENDPSTTSGQPFGNLERKFTECVTSGPSEAKYHCLMRRLNPGNSVYVVFSCGDEVADIKMISSAQSLVGLDSDVNCSGNYNYTPQEARLEYAERGEFLGCQSTSDEEENINAGFEQEQEIVHRSAFVEEIGHDIRFSDFSVLEDIFGWEINIGGIDQIHGGALWEKDCVFYHGPGGPGSLQREYVIANPLNIFSEPGDFSDVAEKCNLDPNRDGDGALDGEGSILDDADELTIPFRYDIPTFQEEHEQVRVWETRTSLQRELQDPRAFAQYNHSMFGECVGEYFLRNFGEEEEDAPVPCNVIERCGSAVGNPVKNTHTTHSFGSLLASPMLWDSILIGGERDPEDIICHKEETGEDIRLFEIQPFIPTDPCEPGTSGCVYKLSSEYYVPQFFLASGGVKKPKTTETINDSYGQEYPRSIPFEVRAEEAKGPLKSGEYINFEDKSSQQTNSGRTSIRLSTENFVDEEVGADVIVNSFVSPANYEDGVYDYNSQGVIWDIGGDVKSLCAISSTTGATPGSRIIPDITSELGIEDLISNFFRGDKEDHTIGDPSQSAGSSVYATEWAKARDAAMAGQYAGRDLFDSWLRYSSGGGELDLSLLTLLESSFRTIATRGPDNTLKSFAERTDGSTADSPGAAWDDTGFNPYMTVEYCIAEDTFSDSNAFPPYGSGNYPGPGIAGCYDWDTDVPDGELCGVWPGPPSQWPPDLGPNYTVEDLGPYVFDVWPGIEGELRTCKLQSCRVWVSTRSCAYEQCVGGYDASGNYYETCYCPDLDGDGNPDSDVNGPRDARGCRPSEEYSCLVNQLDTSEADPPPPDQLESIYDYDDTRSSVVRCDLWKAGPMKDPGDLEKDLSARSIQEPFFDESQTDADPLIDSSNYSSRVWQSPVMDNATIARKPKASFTDWATTNTTDEFSADFTTQRSTSGQRSKGFGTGSTVDMLKPASFPYRVGQFTEAFPYDEVDQDSICNYDDSNNWCYVSDDVPTPIDLDTLPTSSCTPNTASASCDERVRGSLPAIADRILGAAGENAGTGVNGALLVAAMYGEGGWIGAGASYLDWTDENVRAWSVPWYARMPNCDDMQVSAQGPFGLLTSSFEDAIEQNGFHPNRVGIIEYGSGSDTYTLVVPSKCNFLDAAYAAAELLNTSGVGNCSYSRDEARNALAIYRGGAQYAQIGAPNVPEYLVDIAMSCQ